MQRTFFAALDCDVKDGEEDGHGRTDGRTSRHDYALAREKRRKPLISRPF